MVDNAWQARVRKQKAEAKAAEKKKRGEIKSALEAVGKVVPHFPLNGFTRGLDRARAETIRKALDVLAAASVLK